MCYAVSMAMINIKPECPEHEQYIFCNSNLLIKNTATMELPDVSLSRKLIEEHLAIDWFTDTHYGYSAMMLEDTAPIPSGYETITMRELYAHYGDAENAPTPYVTRALALLKWRQSCVYCSRCGSYMQDDETETARVCSSCDNIVFPRISPAIIVLVSKGDTVLLARHAKRNAEVYTCLAGFVENGESLEECVSREILEECGIEVCNIRYAGSQAWPYPDQLMCAFHADWESGEITIQDEELEDAKWFDRNDLPNIPSAGTIAHKLIMGWV